jgi:RNA polymerase sigma factor (sigma-70 family)
MEHVRRSVLRDDSSTDGQLLLRFIENRDDAAFAALVRRHGTMVWGVCCRLLDQHDAEDAFQATFLVLVRKASSIMPREKVANWLYGVAYQTSLHARRTMARKRTREKQVLELPESAVAAPDLVCDLKHVLDQELSRLPDFHREVVVLSDLEGRTRQEVARQLGVPEGTVASRLARARAMLAKRLTKRGITLSAGPLAAVLAQAASARVPGRVQDATVKAAAGQAVSSGVAALTEGVMKAMLFIKLKAAIPVMLILGLLAAGATLLTYRTAAQAQEQKTRPGKKADKPKTDQELIQGTWVYVALTVGGKNEWSDDVASVWKSLSFADDVVRLVVNRDGKEVVHQARFNLHPFRKPKEIDLTELDPDLKEVMTGCLYELDGDTLRLCHPERSGEGRPRTLESKEGSTNRLWTLKRKTDEKPKRGPYTTGPIGPDIAPQMEGFTAWGKEVGGLQAGLGFRPGEHRAYHTGETVTLAVRVRNVGKQETNLDYMREYLQNSPPKIVDDEGRPYPRPTIINDFGEQTPVQLTLAPGKESDLYTLKLALRPVSEKENRNAMEIYGTGKFQIQETGLLGNCWTGTTRINTAFSGMFSGKLELEVKENERFTAWGKEINGLQAGLGFRSGAERVYRHGETVTLVLRLRNVGKETVKFSYLQPFIEHSPTVTDSDGKPVPQPEVIPDIGERDAGVVELPPGREIELHELKRELRPAKWLGNDRVPSLYGTGKFSLQYEHVLGPPEMGLPNWKLDPALSKLATGKLELKVQEAAK